MNKEGWKIVKQKAEEGCSQASWEIAESYWDGLKDKKGNFIALKNKRLALEWYQRSAEYGNKYAQNTLGVILSDGKLVPKNIKKSLYWFKRALKNGDKCAANNIAILYRDLKNYRRSFFWFKKALEGGDFYALTYLGKYYYEGVVVKQNLKFAISYFKKVIKYKSIDDFAREEAMYLLGKSYAEG